MQICIDFLCQTRSHPPKRLLQRRFLSLMERSTAAIELTRWAGAVVTAPGRTKKDIETNRQGRERERERDKETNTERQTKRKHKRNIQSHMEREERQVQKVTC